MKEIITLQMRACYYFSLFFFAGLTCLHGVAAAAVMPDLVRLSPLSDGIIAPTDVALDRNGQIFIAETKNNRITILSQSGQSTGNVLTEVTAPISVAVDANSRILVGRIGSVALYGPDLGFLFKLGTGDGEFIEPADIAIDSNGRIYVVDTQENSISIYSSTGVLTGSIGTPGNADGQLHHPTSIAIDSNTGEIIVLDHQQIYDSSSGNMIDGARIQYFDMTGSLLRAYNKFGYNNTGTIDGVGATIYDVSMGKLHRPSQLTVDGSSRVYVTDVTMHNVMIYDNNDNFLGAINNITRHPRGIAIDTSNRLYVASVSTDKVEVLGTDSYTALSFTPTEMQFSAIENGGAPPSQTATLSNRGGASFTWTASTASAWIIPGAATGTLAPDETALLGIAVASSGLAPGTHTGSVTVDTGAGAAEDISITLTIQANPIQVTPGSLSFQTTVGTTPAGQQLTVFSSVGANLLWNSSADQPWITLNRTVGTTPGAVKVYTDIASLAPGTHNGVITFVQQADSQAPVEIPVSITVAESTNPPDVAHPAIASGEVKWDRKWTISQALPGTALNGVAGSSAADVFAVGENGTILHFDGRDWAPMNSTATQTLNSVWVSSQSKGYAVGAEGQVLNYNGTSWSQGTVAREELRDIWGSSETQVVTAGTFGSILDSSSASTAELGTALRTVSGRSANDIYAAGEPGVIHQYNGSWIRMAPGNAQWLNGLWAAPSDDLYGVGENGTIVHYDGTSWTTMSSGTTRTLNGVCGFSADNVYAVGGDSLILHYDGTDWSAVDAGVGADLNDIWCNGDDIFAVGDNGTVIHANATKKFPLLSILPQIIANAVREKNEGTAIMK